MTKRAFDLVVAFVIAIILAPIMVVVALAILILDGRPVFYVSERMKAVDKGFPLIKFRTMRTSLTDSGVSGGDKSDRITRTGRLLRRSRLDEIPQVFNVLRGDISFVGPRPPLRQYVEQFPELYGRVLASRPGITGLASLLFHAHEEHLLARTTNAAETHAIYTRACIPRKARLDLIYQQHQSVCFDMKIMVKTVIR